MTDDVRSRVDAAGQVRRRTAVKADAHQPGRLPAAQDRRETPTSIFGCALPEPDCPSLWLWFGKGRCEREVGETDHEHPCTRVRLERASGISFPGGR
jgi:hypothetical protein